MTSSIELLTHLRLVVEQDYNWKKEVRFSQFMQHFVFFSNPKSAPDYLASIDFPKGIKAILRILNDKSLMNKAKIAEIKTTLLKKGYNGEKEGFSWLRTDQTHRVYVELAKAIADYEKEQKPAINAGWL